MHLSVRFDCPYEMFLKFYSVIDLMCFLFKLQHKQIIEQSKNWHLQNLLKCENANSQMQKPLTCMLVSDKTNSAIDLNCRTPGDWAIHPDVINLDKQ